MSSKTIIELDHDRFREIESDPAAFAEAVMNQLRIGSFGLESIPGGQVVASFDRARDPHIWRWWQEARQRLPRTFSRQGGS